MKKLFSLEICIFLACCMLTIHCDKKNEEPVKDQPATAKKTPPAPEAGNLAKECEGGNATSCDSLGVQKAQSGEIEAAMSLFAKACEGGEVKGCTNLALGRLRGDGIEQDAGKAMDLLKKSCEGGHGKGCTMLGALLAKDDKFKESADMYKKGCDLKHQDGCKLLKEACSAGDKYACDLAK